MGRCPECGEWGSVDEVAALPAASSASSRTATAVLPSTAAQRITEIDPTTSVAIPTGIGEFDRVLGSGVVPGSVVLLAGEPGVGKSTLLLEAVRRWAESGRTALYITGEESAGQVRLRAERTGAVNENIYLAAESDLGTVLGHAESLRPGLMIVDSVQTMIAGHADGVTGGVTQIKAVTSALVSLAKTSGTAVFLVGHVTKDGQVAGPRSLEHLVDVVLSFEGDRHSSLRMVRGVKNRFGPSDEVGCFEQRDTGIREVTDPSGLFLQHREATVTGSAITVAMDGKRALVGEIQALFTNSPFATPRREVSGLDSSRVAMVMAVLDARVGLKMEKRDVYASTVGGMKISEPSADLAVALAISSMHHNRPLPAGTVMIGEVGLAGEVRRVPAIGRRIAEAKRLGFTRAFVPAGCLEDRPTGISVVEVGTLSEAIDRTKADADEPAYTF